MSGFKTSVWSNFKELWRYNITVVCELCAADGTRLEYKAEESEVAPVGANLQTPPEDYSKSRSIVVESGDGDYLNLLIYVVPNTLPTTDDIYATKPFSLVVKVEKGGDALLNRVFEINQWSGDNLSLERVGADEK